ncbi:hypothetical protein PRIPAC_74355 [Pristionchus pacificus]|uniref:Uncharacterized protein n=1 Tax=Pristionchus pacificus TaxID=54126 RepID=A0A2A6C840_PRIPA|nr:hypothetical protein PRIPAC_74355 [Pristionchus pacificus]|eukprot:PDM74329.1 hypothetical protein PRIPAC_41685 [Pristionchus pacificus]
MNTSLFFVLLSLPLIANALNEADTTLVQKLRKEYRTELYAFLDQIKVYPQLKAVYDDFMACKTTTDQASTALLKLLPTFYPSNDKRDRNLSALAAMLVLIDSMDQARDGCKKADTAFVQKLRKEYRTELYAFLDQIKVYPQLKAVYDDFMACKTTTDQASTALLKLLPTFYPSNDKRDRNLSALAAMLVLIDSMDQARDGCKKADTAFVQKLRKEYRTELYAFLDQIKVYPQLKADTAFVQKLRKEYRTELYAFLDQIKVYPQLKAVYDDFMACKTTTDQASTALLKLLPTFYPSNDKRDRNLSALAAMLVLIDSMDQARDGCKKADTAFVQKLRKEYRTELYAFLDQIKVYPQLKAVYDDFMACKTTTDQASTALLKLLPTFYPSNDKRDRNLSALAAMLVLIDSMDQARGGCKKADTAFVQKLRKEYRTELYAFLDQIKVYPQLKANFDDFMACKTTPDEASAALLKLLPTFYPSNDKRDRNLSALAAMLVLIDSVDQARGGCKKV